MRKVKIFADGADLPTLLALHRDPLIQGFTTNPTLMRKAGVGSYQAFAREVLARVTDRPVSFAVLADDFAGMEAQARRISSWGGNVYVKIPITNTRGESAAPLLRRLSQQGVKVNATALLTLEQVRAVADALAGGAPASVSIFAGRIADTGVDPVPVMSAALEILAGAPGVELVWASPREVFNVAQADAIGCHIVTVTPDLLKKLPLLGRPLAQLSLETVQMFHRDAEEAGFTL